MPNTPIVPYWKYAIIPVVVVLVMIFIPGLAHNVIKSVPTWDYIVSSLILLFSISLVFFQVQDGGDTNKVPYLVQILALAVFLTWAWNSQPAV